MYAINIIGLCGSCGVAIAFIPQTYKTITTDSIKSISFITMYMVFSSSICMLIYSMYYNILPMLIANVSVMINTGVIMVVYLYKKNETTLSQLHPPSPQ